MVSGLLPAKGLQGVLEWRIKEKLSEAKEHQLFLISKRLWRTS